MEKTRSVLFLCCEQYKKNSINILQQYHTMQRGTARLKNGLTEKAIFGQVGVADFISFNTIIWENGRHAWCVCSIMYYIIHKLKYEVRLYFAH